MAIVQMTRKQIEMGMLLDISSFKIYLQKKTLHKSDVSNNLFSASAGKISLKKQNSFQAIRSVNLTQIVKKLNPREYLNFLKNDPISLVAFKNCLEKNKNGNSFNFWRDLDRLENNYEDDLISIISEIDKNYFENDDYFVTFIKKFK